jgi:hypothetical protein
MAHLNIQDGPDGAPGADIIYWEGWALHGATGWPFKGISYGGFGGGRKF